MSHIQQTTREWELSANVSGGGVVERANRADGVRAWFADGGAMFELDGERVGLRFAGVGRGGTVDAGSRVAPVASGNRVSYEHGGDTHEWYANGPAGLEHGFTLDRRPAGTAPLTLGLAVDGARVHVEDDGRDATFTTNGRSVGGYQGLWATDADGRWLPSWMTSNSDRLLVHVADDAARYPIIVDPYVRSASLTTVGDGARDLGSNVAISGETIVVKAQGIHPASAYLYTQPPGGWKGNQTEHARLVVPEASFSFSLVAIAGDTVVGGPGGIPLYVFTKPADGWTGTVPYSAKLVPSDKGSFGRAVAILEDTIVVAGQERAYVFLRPADGWTGTLNESAQLVASDNRSDQSWLPIGCAIAENTVVIGDPDHTVGDNKSQGQVYVYRRPSDGWSGTLSESTRLLASDGGSHDAFGSSVAISDTPTTGQTIFALAPFENNFFGPGIGRIYVYPQPGSGTVKQEAAQLHPPDPGAVDNDFITAGLGPTMAVDGERVIGFDALRMSVFQQPAAGWSGTVYPRQYLLDDGSVYLIGVASSNGTVVSGTDGLNTPPYVFTFTND